MNQPNPYAPPRSQVADVPAADSSPALWNPVAAARWSLLFSPIFGSLLHMKNWQALGQPDKAEESRKWFIGSVVFFVLVFLATLVLPDSKGMDLFTRIAGLALLLSWYYASGKAQQAHVLARFGKDYPRRGWGKPLLFALLAILGLFVVAVVLGLIFGGMQG